LAEASNSTNPELVERLNLASIILDTKFITHAAVLDYLRWAEANDRLPNSMMQIFSKYVFARRADSDDVGIYPFLNDLFDSMQEIVNLGEFPELKNPEQRIQQIRSGLSDLEDSVDDYRRKLAELDVELSEARRLENRLSQLKSEYDQKLVEFERVSASNKDIEERLTRFENEYSEQTFEKMKERSIELSEKLDDAREKFNGDVDIKNYISRLSAAIAEHDALEQISKYRRTMLELNEDLVIADNICHTVDINTAALQSAMIKMQPYSDEFKNELKSVVQQLTKT
jgi:chromosome segregation ATPase